MGALADDLQQPGVERIETHISQVFLSEREVWKVKRPVALGFLDFTTPERRRLACEAEVRLNRRLAPGVYHGVVPVTRDGAGRHRFAGRGETVDWAVHMARLPDGDRADVRLAQGRLSAEQVERIAEHVAAFHAGARCDEHTAHYGRLHTIAGNVRENFEQTRDTLHHYVSPADAREIETWQHRFLDRHADLFEARIDARRVRDGHGDLRLEHVYLDGEDRVTVVDCIEFNERFRFADVCADVAFLAMDLTWHEHVGLAERFLAAYARAANDYDLYPLVDFYESYRAFVRGKIAAMLATDPAAGRVARARASRQARRYFLLALASERRSLLPPGLVAVGGVIASGKSTVAARIAAEMAAPAVDADRTRKHLLGAAPEEPVHVPPWQDAYAPEVTEEVYGEVFRRAAAVLASGRSVVLDASFRARRHRAAARRLAAEHGVPFRFVECRAGIDVLRRRLERRAREGGVSDGRLEILDEFVAGWEPVDELDPQEHQLLDTERPLAGNMEVLRPRLATWPG